MAELPDTEENPYAPPAVRLAALRLWHDTQCCGERYCFSGDNLN